MRERKRRDDEIRGCGMRLLLTCKQPVAHVASRLVLQTMNIVAGVGCRRSGYGHSRA